MTDPFDYQMEIDHDLDSYRTIFDHGWAERVFRRVESTKLRAPFFELTINWRAAVNTHCFPWMMMQSLSGLWEGSLKGESLPLKFVNVLADKIPTRMRSKMTHTAQQDLFRVLKELAEEVNQAVERGSEGQMDAPAWWRHFLSVDMKEFFVAIWGSQRFCFGSLYHAYENYFREVLAIKKRDPKYRFRRYKELIEHVTAEFGSAIVDQCLDGNFLKISREVRNSLAHNGGKENQALAEIRATGDHGIPVESGFLQITAQHNRQLIMALQKRATIVTEAALNLPEFRNDS